MLEGQDKSNQLRVISFEPHLVQIEIVKFKKWKEEASSKKIKIGSFLKIEDGNKKNILVLVQSFKMKPKHDEEGKAKDDDEYNGSFVINSQPIGQLEDDGDGVYRFIKGIKNISIPPNGVSLASDDEIQSIFKSEENIKLIFLEHIINPDIKIEVDGDKFFSKHIAVVGSTGSGKSCTVAKIIQEAKSSDNGEINNSHVILFDIHGEYRRAFPDSNYLSIEEKTLKLPYWLMTSEELEDMFISAGDGNKQNQVSQFKYAVIANKQKYNPDIKVTYDSPVYFSLTEVFNFIVNKNNLTVYEKEGKIFFASIEKNFEYDEDMLWEPISFKKSSGNAKDKDLEAKVSKFGGFTDEFERFISRLETKLNDERLSFILKPKNQNGKEYKTENLEILVKKLLGYVDNNKNVSIVDLSSLPFEVVSIVVSVISRLVFDFSYFSTRLANDGKTNETPFMLVYEEAHKYIPKNEEVRYRNTRLAVERIAKEGRKYGISTMIVSQRPSEISSTVFSQCNNFVVMRLNNPEDQAYVKRLLPEAVASYGDALSSLEKREALFVGDAVSTPVIGKVLETNPLPKSDDINFYSEWKENWKDIVFDKIIKSINKENEK